MRDDRERLADILEAIDRIDRHVGRGREALDADEMLQTWMVHHPRVHAASPWKREVCRAGW